MASDIPKINRDPIGFYDLLSVMFIGLKLCKVIDWYWILVLCPVLLHLALMTFFAFLVGIVESRRSIR